MKKYFNMMYYFIYRFDFKLHILFKKINPVVLLHKLINNKAKHNEYNKALDHAMREPKFGVSSMFAGGILYGIYFLFFFSILIFLGGILKYNFNLSKLHGLFIAMPVFVILYYSVFKKDLYLKYFSDFEKIPKKRLKFLALLYFLNILGIICFFVLSLMYMSHRNY